MGANQSSAETRSVSMDNPAPSGVIDVSEEVVQRLKLGISKAKQQEKQTPVKEKQATTPAPVIEYPKAITPSSPPAMLSPPPPQPPTQSTTKSPSPSTSMAKAAALAKAAAPPYPRFTGEPATTSMEWRRQKDSELRANDEFWRARIAELEETLNKTNQVMEKECLKAIEETKSRLVGLSGDLPQFPCLEEKNKVIACYRSNPNQTLNCADVVAKFSECVAHCRTKKLESLQREQKQQPPAKAA